MENIQKGKLIELKGKGDFYEETKYSDVQYLKLKAPLFAQFEVTGNCNQGCVFCYNVWKEESQPSVTHINLSKQEQLKIIDKLIENEIFSLIFSGGEPLLIPWVEELISKVSAKGIETSLVTNGILLNKERVEKLELSGLNSIQISLHSHKDILNNSLVNKDAFGRTVQGINNALEVFGNSRINVNMVVLPKTYMEVFEMAKFLNSIGVKNFSIGAPSVTGEISKDKRFVIHKKEFQNVYHQLIKAKEKFNMNVSFTGGFPFCALPEINKESLSMISNTCDAGLNQLIIGPEGDIRPCVCLNNKVGNVQTDNIQEIWKENEFLRNLRILEFLPKECLDCDYKHLCRGGCRASAFGYYGKMNAIDPLTI